MKFIILLFAILILSCKNKTEVIGDQLFTNKAIYNIEIGDRLELYYTTNSCCKYCCPNKNKLNHLKYIGEKTVVETKKGCAGCSYTRALIFEATSTGTDTLKAVIITAPSDCRDTINNLEKHIVNVKE